MIMNGLYLNYLIFFELHHHHNHQPPGGAALHISNLCIMTIGMSHACLETWRFRLDGQKDEWYAICLLQAIEL